ncbi:NUDIX hydrolase [Microtetraspora sp. NBRC 16547]|uniref:NUDIX domain-containing protein n=1 Tax=Microtetraspora sp. NBRC 16547 TaxID=3030993 RepID=UPI0025539BC2|nr:NUDIX hydrolase [Microtetraspora sp. NBRC 16547]
MSASDHASDRDPDLAYIAGLVRVRAAAGALIRDDAGRVLLVRPTYKETWDIPGGSLERDESPRAACVRELAEELSITPEIGPLLCVDWVPPLPPWDGGLIFVFDGGVLSAEDVADIRLPPDELDRFAFVAADDLDDLVRPAMARRLRACLETRERGGLYLEDGFRTPRGS